MLIAFIKTPSTGGQHAPEYAIQTLVTHYLTAPDPGTSKTGWSMNQIVSGPGLLMGPCIIIWLIKGNNPEPCDIRRYFRSICNENLKLTNPLFRQIKGPVRL